MLKLKTKQLIQILPSVINNGGAMYQITDFPLVSVGIQEDINEQYCIDNNIPVYRIKRSGGPIVSSVGDYDFVIVEKNNKFRQPQILTKLLTLLVSKNIKVEFENNDLLVDGYKVASYACRDVPGGLYTAIHISMSVNMELIKNICKKEMIKVPKGLYDFGITNDDIDKIITEVYGGIKHA